MTRSGGDAPPGTQRWVVWASHRTLLGVVGALSLLALVGIAVLWPPDDVAVEEDVEQGQTTELVDAVLLDVTEVPDPFEDTFGLLPEAVNVEITARLEETGETVTFEMIDETGQLFAAGQRVRLAAIETPGQPVTYAVADFRRERQLAVLAALFLLAVVAFSRWQGVRALIGLVLTFVLIIGFIVPAILAGRSPVAVALVGALAIMIVTLYLAHGYSRKTTAAVVGTAVALALTGLLAVVFVEAAAITGFTSEDARLANLTVGGLSLQGLLLAGIIIGGLGVLDDVTMSQSSTVFELHRADPRAGFAALTRGALNVGRDHIAATVNTLFLAYAGAALPLLILFATGVDGFFDILTSEIVAVEIVRTLVGSLGLIAAVPITTALAAALVVAEPRAAGAEPRTPGHTHGQPTQSARSSQRAQPDPSAEPAAPPPD
ncbi:MAG: YibE/F family protein [Egibacteraceae bacterium]